MPVSFKSKVPLQQAREAAERLSRLLLAGGLERVEVAGSVRRGKPEVGDLDLVVGGDLGRVREAHGVWIWKEGGDKKATIDFMGFQVNLLVASDEEWGAHLMYFTGPASYNIAYRSRAKKMGMKLNEHGLFDGERRVAGLTEESVYRALGKKWKPPEQRGT